MTETHAPMVNDYINADIRAWAMDGENELNNLNITNHMDTENIEKLKFEYHNKQKTLLTNIMHKYNITRFDDFIQLYGVSLNLCSNYYAFFQVLRGIHNGKIKPGCIDDDCENDSYGCSHDKTMLIPSKYEGVYRVIPACELPNYLLSELMAVKKPEFED